MLSRRMTILACTICLATPFLLFGAINHVAIFASDWPVFALGAALFAGCFAAGAVIARLPQRLAPYWILALVNFGLFFLYGPLNDLLTGRSSSILFREYNWSYLILCGVVNAAILLTRVRAAVAFGLFFLLLAPVLGLQVQRHGHDGLVPQSPRHADTPNIYYFILDAHPGTRYPLGLPPKEKADFERFLSETGFVAMEEGRSNYVQTRQAMEAITDLAYIDSKRAASSEANFHYPENTRQARPPRLEQSLSEAGYTIHDIYDAGTGCQVRYSTCHYPPAHFTLAGMIGEIANFTPLRLWKSFARALTSVDALAMAIKTQAILLPAKRPFFMLVHHISPHPPYLYDKACRRGFTLNNARPASDWAPERLPDFIHETACLNRDVARTVRTVIARDSTAIIVLQSDHGPWFRMYPYRDAPLARWPDEAVAERLAYLNQIRVPKRCQAYARPDLAQVNTARLIVACARHEVPAFLPERSFLTSYSDDTFRELPAKPPADGG